jgi:hypothetical protein
MSVPEVMSCIIFEAKQLPGLVWEEKNHLFFQEHNRLKM